MNSRAEARLLRLNIGRLAHFIAIFCEVARAAQAAILPTTERCQSLWFVTAIISFVPSSHASRGRGLSSDLRCN